MLKFMLLIVLFLFSIQFSALAEQAFETDAVKTSEGDLKITFLGHGTLMFSFLWPGGFLDQPDRCVIRVVLAQVGNHRGQVWSREKDAECCLVSC